MSQKEFYRICIKTFKKTEIYQKLCQIPEIILLNYLKNMQLAFNTEDLQLAIILQELYTFMNGFLVLFSKELNKYTAEKDQPNCSTTEDIETEDYVKQECATKDTDYSIPDTNDKECATTESTPQTNDIELSTNQDVDLYTKYNKRRFSFAYVTFAIQNKNIQKLAIGTFSNIVVIHNCHKSWIEQLKYYIEKFKIETLYIRQCKNFNFQMEGININFFKLKKDASICINCKNKDCMSGSICQYFRLFHYVEFNDCDYN